MKGRDGKIRERNTYGKDPIRRKGDAWQTS
ncbi:hypothetical protein FLP41_14505 [Paracoccus marcusii]|nr:hypothetical protein FLP41_14505 [Paracoccus marcusii]